MCQDVNQETGEDLNPYRRKGDEEDISARNPDRPLSMPLVNVPEINEISEKKAVRTQVLKSLKTLDFDL